MSAAAVSLHCGPEMCGSCREWIDSQLAAKDAEIEALKSKTPHTSCWAEIETLKARVKKLMEYIRVAPHGGMCASIEHLNSYYADHPRPLCDCWKAAALEEEKNG